VTFARRREDGYLVSTDRARLDLDAIHGFLRTAYWSEGVTRETVERSIRGSMPFGLYAPDGAQAGFARVVSDRAVFAYLGDVFVLEAHRGRGLGVFLIECVVSHPDLQGLRRFHLATADAHGLYARFGFAQHPQPGMLMDRLG
jgi:GNAT superfamily N-acetyltransferase